MTKVNPMHRIIASLIHNGRRDMSDVMEDDREGVQYVLDTEYKKENNEEITEGEN